MDLEHHQLILRYEHLRVRCPERERRLLAALAGHGQQMPIVVVAAEETERFVEAMRPAMDEMLGRMDGAGR